LSPYVLARIRPSRHRFVQFEERSVVVRERQFFHVLHGILTTPLVALAGCHLAVCRPGLLVTQKSIFRLRLITYIYSIEIIDFFSASVRGRPTGCLRRAVQTMNQLLRPERYDGEMVCREREREEK